MIDLITQFIPWEFIAAGVGAVVALVAAWLSGKRSGAVRAGNQAAAKSAKAREAGRKGEAEAKADLAKGKTPEEIVRANDGDWR